MCPCCQRFECFCIATCNNVSSVGRCQYAQWIGVQKKILDSFLSQNCNNGQIYMCIARASIASLRKESMQDLEATSIQKLCCYLSAFGISNQRVTSNKCSSILNKINIVPMLITALNFHNAKMLLYVGQSLASPQYFARLVVSPPNRDSRVASVTGMLY